MAVWSTALLLSLQPPLPCPACLPPAQKAEELAAAEARRPPVIVAQPTLHLELPEALQQAPPRLDMCSECARTVQEVRRRKEGAGKGGEEGGASAEHAM